MNIRPATPEDYDPLVDLWFASVRATHAFLTEDDIQELLPVVRDVALPALELWVLCSDDGAPIGFMGLADSSVEALFLAPAWFRRGGGKLLLDHARRLKRTPLRVDVNEQNPEAVAFYRANGFEVVGRSEVDGAGRPFPLLHMKEGEKVSELVEAAPVYRANGWREDDRASRFFIAYAAAMLRQAGPDLVREPQKVYGAAPAA